jgi:outer membrane protein OmpA-like peptidoglycan-associated protein
MKTGFSILIIILVWTVCPAEMLYANVPDTTSVSAPQGRDTLSVMPAPPERIDEIRRRIEYIRSQDLSRGQYIPRLGPSEAETDIIRRQNAEQLDIIRLTNLIRLLEMMDDSYTPPAPQQVVIVPGIRRDGIVELPSFRDVYPAPPDTVTEIRVDTLRVTRVDTVFVDRVETEIIELRRMLETGVFRAFSIVFEFDKYDILPSSHRILDEAGQLLLENPEIRMEVQGHTDNTGPRDYNMRLSQRRAESVRDYLLSNFPDIGQERIRAAGFGPDNPVTENRTATERALNRRVEFKIIEGD